MKMIFSLLRVNQYLKNLIVFLPLFFAQKISDPALLHDTAIAFICFCFLASAVYIINDLIDIDYDKTHSLKKLRPLASGQVNKVQALIVMLIMAGISFTLSSLLLNLQVTLLLAVYAGINICYSVWLKHYAVIDISLIAAGFVIRIFVGSFASGVDLSHWIVLMTFLLALFLALAKRRDDVVVFLKNGEKQRKVADGYNVKLLDSSLVIMSSVLIVSYMIYTISAETVSKFHTDKLYLTIVFIILGLLRYLQLTYVQEKSGSPTNVFINDICIQLCVIGWIISCSFLLYWL